MPILSQIQFRNIFFYNYNLFNSLIVRVPILILNAYSIYFNAVVIMTFSDTDLSTSPAHLI